jgi:hypothetical protein
MPAQTRFVERLVEGGQVRGFGVGQRAMAGSWQSVRWSG